MVHFTTMRWTLLGLVVCGTAAVAAPASGMLAPEAIKEAFFTGQAFTAATPSGVKYKMLFTPDGKVTREPIGRAGQKGEGSWILSKDGFCTAWKGGRQNCYRLIAAGENKWSVMNGPALMAVWSKRPARACDHRAGAKHLFLPLPSRSRMFPTSANLVCRTRVDPSSDGER